MTNSHIALILSPLAFFLLHVIYLAVWSPDPFLNKWIDGSFTFFVALVLCNIIRARFVPAPDSTGPGEDAPPGPEDQSGGAPP